MDVPDRRRAGRRKCKRRTARTSWPAIRSAACGYHQRLATLQYEGAANQSGARPLRTLFAFDPRRTAILLIGGDKTGEKRFYDRMVPIADGLYDEYLKEIKKEGLI